MPSNSPLRTLSIPTYRQFSPSSVFRPPVTSHPQAVHLLRHQQVVFALLQTTRRGGPHPASLPAAGAGTQHQEAPEHPAPPPGPALPCPCPVSLPQKLPLPLSCRARLLLKSYSFLSAGTGRNRSKLHLPSRPTCQRATSQHVLFYKRDVGEPDDEISQPSLSHFPAKPSLSQPSLSHFSARPSLQPAQRLRQSNPPPAIQW